MSEPQYQLYCHVNKINGKAYYGITKNTWQDRWATKYKGNAHFNRAITKYGEGAWRHEIVADGMTAKDAAEWEKALIAFFDTTNPEKGYNKGKGGEGVSGLDSLYAVQQSREYHEALSGAMKKVWSTMPEEERLRRINNLRAHTPDKDELSKRDRKSVV